jgi:hypothetical protein
MATSNGFGMAAAGMRCFERELGVLNIELADASDGRIAAKCDQLPGFCTELAAGETLVATLRQCLQDHLLKNYEIDPIIRERANIVQFHLYEQQSVPAFAAVQSIRNCS